MSEQLLEQASHCLAEWLRENPAEVKEKEAALERYGKYFAAENLDKVTSEGFRDFLLLKNNRHWDTLYRHPEIYEDMDRLRKCLKILLDESRPIADRLDFIIPKNGPPFIKGLNRAVLTAILMCVRPNDYAVYNRKSDVGLTELGLNRAKAKDSFGNRYVAINEACKEIAEKIKQPLHLVDLMFAIMKPPTPEAGVETDESEDVTSFALPEDALRDSLIANWDNTPLATALRLSLHKEHPDDEDESAAEFRTPVGPIDILARDQDKNWVVIELKKGKSNQGVVGQILKYMGYLKSTKAEKVRGIILTNYHNEHIKYALSGTTDIEHYTYRISFELTLESPLASSTPAS